VRIKISVEFQVDVPPESDEESLIDMAHRWWHAASWYMVECADQVDIVGVEEVLVEPAE